MSKLLIILPQTTKNTNKSKKLAPAKVNIKYKTAVKPPASTSDPETEWAFVTTPECAWGVF